MYVPAEQLKHSTGGPRLAAFMPALQVEHSALPLAYLNSPGAHAEHARPSGPVCPALHLQLVKRLLPFSDVEFAGHWVQSEAPVPAAYLPGAQRAHALSDDAAVAAAYVPAGQPAQVLFEDAPAAAEYVPAAQWSQAVLGPAVLNLPASQSAHAVWAPGCAVYFPAGHDVQASLRRLALNVPAPHTLHAFTVAFQYPALHEQEAEPKSLSELARHETQDADPLAALYLPASHAEHNHAGPV